MQTDTWLTQPSHPVKCPLCSKRLKDGALICFSCGFQVGQIPARGIAASSRRSIEQVPPGGTSSVWIDPAASALQMSPSAEREPTKGMPPARPNPITPHPLSKPHPQAGEAAQRPSSRRKNPLTPIPSRASAQNEASPHRGTWYPKQSASVSSGADVTRLPTQPDMGPQMWQYESESYEVGSSVQSLSLLVSEAPTRPEAPISSRSPNLPIDGSNLVTIDEIDTLPHRANSVLLPAPVSPTPAVSPAANLPQGITGEFSLQPTSADLPSWTAGEAARSPYAQRIADRGKNVGTALVVAQMNPRSNLALNPLEKLRWWLLRPGRMEFLLWLCGTLLLIGVTCVLLLTAAFSFEWIIPGSHNGTTYTSAPTINPGGSPTRAASPSSRTAVLSLSLMDKGPFLPGHLIHLRGQGFSPHDRVTFTYDNNQLLLDQSGHPSMVQADSQGTFTATILLGNWGTGKHRIVAHDSNRSIEISFVLASSSSATGPTATATPPRVPATPTVVSGGSPTPVPTAVGATPVPPTSTPTPTRTATPTPTPATTPTATVTPGSTTTPGPGSNTPVASPTTAPAYSSTSSSLSNSLNGASDADVTARLIDALANLGPWAWFVIPGYGVAMILLGVAGVLRRHRKV